MGHLHSYVYLRISAEFYDSVVSLMFFYVCHILLKMCVGHTELENGARPTARACQRDILTAHGGDKTNMVGNL